MGRSRSTVLVRRCCWVPVVAFAAWGVAGCNEGGSPREAQAEEPPPPARALPVAVALGPGTPLHVALTDDLRLRFSRRGSVWRARVTDDVRSLGGATVIPAGSAIVGRVTALTHRPRTFTIVVESLTVRERAVPLAAIVDSVEQQHRTEPIAVIEAVRAGVGPGEGGAVLGMVLRQSERGTVIGAEPGRRAGSDVVLPAGGHLLLTLRTRFTLAPD